MRQRTVATICLPSSAVAATIAVRVAHADDCDPPLITLEQHLAALHVALGDTKPLAIPLDHARGRLRLDFIGSNGDPAIVVNDPYGDFHCVDDSVGTVNPTIDSNNPAGGSDDVWVAGYAHDATVSGTFYITGDASHHP